MNILYLPYNVASMPALTAEGISKLQDVNVRVLSLGENKFRASNEHVISLAVSRKNPINWLYNKITYRSRILKYLQWADVVHYFWGPLFSDYSDLELCKKYGKKIFVEWVGSDIRNPEVISPINKYYSAAISAGYEYSSIESKESSLYIQTKFASFGAIPIMCPEMLLYLDKTLFPKFYLSYQRQNVSAFIPSFPKINKVKPLIIHSPSAPIAKGTQYILDVIDQLKETLDFDFQLIVNVDRSDLLALMSKADIYIDQMICGSYGMAATEAMSLGKVVMAFIMPEVFEVGLSKNCPIVNVNPDSLKEQLALLIQDPVLRHNIGRASRQFVEQYHDTNKIATDMISIYERS